MTAEEIRKAMDRVSNEMLNTPATLSPNGMVPLIFMLGEVAAQLAELNTHMKSVAETMYVDGMAKYGQ